MELSKNNRFRTGSTVDIFHTPVYETNTLDIVDVSVGDDYAIEAVFEEDVTIEQFSVGDICAMSFGVGDIVGDGNASNEILYSNNLNFAPWILDFGTLEEIFADDSWLIHSADTGASSAAHILSQSVAKSGVSKTYTFSAYVKDYGCEKVRIEASNDVFSGGYAVIDFSFITGEVYSSQEGNGFTLNKYNVFDEGDGWFRISIQYTTDTNIETKLKILMGAGAFVGDGVEGMFVKDAQLSEGDLTKYIATADTPEYSFARTQTGSNLLVHSEDIGDDIWVKTNVDIALDSNYNIETMFTPADNLAATITSGEHKISQTVTKTAEVKTYTASVHLIQSATETLQLKVTDANGTSTVQFDWEQQQFVIGTDVATGTWTLIDKGYDVMVGSSYKRFWMTFECSADVSLDFEVGLVYGYSTTDFGGVVVSIDVAGMQLEENTQVGEYKVTTDIIVEPILIGSILEISFPKSMFPDSNVAKYVGDEIQHALFFLRTGRVVANFTVAKYKEVVKQAVYGYAKVIYNLQTEADLVLTPIKMVDDGTLNAILYSKGFVLKACDTSNYTPETSWNTEFPLELSGTSIDPIYRRAYLKKRAMESSGRKARAKLEFRLIG